MNQSHQRDFGSGSSAALSSFVLIVASILIGVPILMAANNPSTASGIIDGRTLTGLFVAAMLLFLWVPVFLGSLVLAIKAVRQGDSWGYACILAHVLMIGGFCAFSMLAKTLDTPERRAAQQRKWRERMSNRHKPKPLGGIDIPRDSTFYQFAASPWLLRGSVAVLALGLALRTMRHYSLSEPPPDSICTQSETQIDASPLDAKCPVCHTNVGRVLVSGGRSCPSCHTAFLQESTQQFQRKERAKFVALFVEGSSLQRIGAAAMAGGLLFFSAAWLWYWALGDSAASTRLLILAALLAGGLGAMFLGRSAVDRTA